LAALRFFERSEAPSAFSSTFSFFSSCFALRFFVAVAAFDVATAFLEALGILPAFYLGFKSSTSSSSSSSSSSSTPSDASLTISWIALLFLYPIIYAPDGGS
jgi:hypothetical protein